jgi:hypothetical protein
MISSVGPTVHDGRTGSTFMGDGMVRGMDRRQLLDGVASMARLGDLADDVVLACAAVRHAALRDEDSAALREGLSLVEALTEFERPHCFHASVS